MHRNVPISYKPKKFINHHMIMSLEHHIMVASLLAKRKITMPGTSQDV